MILKELSKLKIGTYFRFQGKKMVYTISKSCKRGSTCYCSNKDVWGSSYTRKKSLPKMVEVDFTY